MDRKPLTETFQWDGRLVRLSYCLNYFTDVAHLEIRSDDGEPLPITETGYLSHFFMGDDPPILDNVILLVKDWLNEKEQSREWRKYVVESRQLNLF